MSKFEIDSNMKKIEMEVDKIDSVVRKEIAKQKNELDMELDEMSDYYAKNKLSNGG